MQNTQERDQGNKNRIQDPDHSLETVKKQFSLILTTIH